MFTFIILVFKNMNTIYITVVFFFLGQTTSFSCLMCCFTIVSGFFLGVDQENLSGKKKSVYYIII